MIRPKTVSHDCVFFFLKSDSIKKLHGYVHDMCFRLRCVIRGVDSFRQIVYISVNQFLLRTKTVLKYMGVVCLGMYTVTLINFFDSKNFQI